MTNIYHQQSRRPILFQIPLPYQAISLPEVFILLQITPFPTHKVFKISFLSLNLGWGRRCCLAKVKLVN